MNKLSEDKANHLMVWFCWRLLDGDLTAAVSTLNRSMRSFRLGSAWCRCSTLFTLLTLSRPGKPFSLWANLSTSRRLAKFLLLLFPLPLLLTAWYFLATFEVRVEFELFLNDVLLYVTSSRLFTSRLLSSSIFMLVAVLCVAFMVTSFVFFYVV